MSSSLARVVVLGATGDVGRGAVAECLARGHEVVAVARRAEALAELSAEHASTGLRTMVGSIADDAAATALAAELNAGPAAAVVVAISLPWPPRPVLETEYDEVSSYWASYLGAHLAAAKAFLPTLQTDGLLLGIGGGMADFAVPGSAVVSMSQAAQRMLYRTLALEVGAAGPAVRELMVVSKVHGRSNHDSARPEWLTDAQIGARIADIIAEPGAERNAGPILKIVPERRGES